MANDNQRHWEMQSAMRQEQQRAVCKVIEDDPSITGGKGAGTGYLVSATLVVTCQHVVENTPIGGRVALHFFRGPLVFGTLRDADPQGDAAVILLEVPLTDIAPLALAERYDGKEAWEGFGYPATAAGDPLPLTGVVDLPNHTIAGRPRMVLQCNEAGDPIHGWSGSPVMVGERAVGHVEGFPRKLDDPSRPAHGKVYAVPVAVVRCLLRPGDLPPQPSPLDAYLRDLVQKTRHIELQGFRSGAGAGRDALSCPVEKLWTPLYGTPIHMRGQGVERSGRPPLTRIVRDHKRLLIEGQPGFGKTTLMKLIAGALARDGLANTGHGAPSMRTKHLGWPEATPWEAPIYLPLRDVARDIKPLAHTLEIKADLLLCVATPETSHREALREALKNGAAIVLLDGLDEVTNDEERKRVLLLVERVIAEWPLARVVITSRPFSTDEVVRLGVQRTTIQPFTRAQVREFLDHWVKAVPGAESGYRAELEHAILDRREIEELAENPVMLTCLCVVHWNERRQLPRGRAAAYKAVFYWLLEARRPQRVERHTQELATYGLPAVALAMMLHPDGKQTSMAFADAARDKVVTEALADLELGKGAVRAGKIEDWLRWECTGSGVIQQDGPSAFRFWHLTFQELLAAEALSEQMLDPSDDWAWPMVRERLFDTQWKETIDLLPACLCMRSKRAAGVLLGRVIGLLGANPSLAEEARMAALAPAAHAARCVRICAAREDPARVR